MGESGKPTKPGKYIIGLPVPGAAGVLVSVIMANHAVGGDRSGSMFVWPVMGLTGFLAFLQVSTIRFRSFKDLRLNTRTVLLVAFAVGSSAVISMQMQPAFVLVWLLGFYVLLGIFETLLQLPARLRTALRDQAAAPRDSAPPPAV
jgi:CDP-diacylglycerol--serine O-phosphatidyltransferase